MKKSNYFYLAIIGMSGLIGGAVNYLYHPIMLRFMSIEDFGIFGSLVGIFNILGVITTGMLLFLNKEFSQNLTDKKKLKSLFWDSTKILGGLGVIIFLLYVFFSPVIADFLKVDSILLVILTGISVIFGFLGIPITAFLRSIKAFEVISISQIIGPIIKLGIGVGFVLLSFNIYGAIIGFLCSGIFVFLFLLYFAIRDIKNETYTSDMKVLLRDFFHNKREIFHFFLMSFFFAIFMNIDVIVVRNLFSPEEAGIYIGISVLGKFLIFLLLSIETVYYGQIMEHKKENLPPHLIRNPIIITVIISLGALVFNYFFGSIVLGILKPELTLYLDVYLMTLIFYGLLALMSFFIKILIGWNIYYTNYILGFLISGLLLSVYHFGSSSLLSFIYVFVTVGIVSVIILGFIFFKTIKKNKVGLKDKNVCYFG